MYFLDDYCMSSWAYFECKFRKDIKEVRKLITVDQWMFLYCRDIKDRKEMWSKITSSDNAYSYCKDVKDRTEVRKHIKNIYWIECYYQDKKHKRGKGNGEETGFRNKRKK